MTWQGTFPVLYYLDTSTIPSNLVDGITDAFDTFNNAIEFVLYERTWDSNDSNITVSFHNIDGKWKTLAMANWNSTDSNPYKIKNATIYFDTSETWGNTTEAAETIGNVTAYDIEEIAAHEVGHISGLAHTKNQSQTMSTNASQGDNFRKTLAAGDLEGFRTIYNGLADSLRKNNSTE